jgi:hypothetical protein
MHTKTGKNISSTLLTNLPLPNNLLPAFQLNLLPYIREFSKNYENPRLSSSNYLRPENVKVRLMASDTSPFLFWMYQWLGKLSNDQEYEVAPYIQRDSIDSKDWRTFHDGFIYRSPSPSL